MLFYIINHSIKLFDIHTDLNFALYTFGLTRWLYEPLWSRSVRTLINQISSSQAPANTTSIHSVRDVCKLVIVFHLSWKNLSKSVDRPVENARKRAQDCIWRRTGNLLIPLAHAQTKCLCAWFINKVDNVNWPPYRDWKADVSSVSPSSEQIRFALTKG